VDLDPLPISSSCKFCYQSAQVLAQDVTCSACGDQAGDPDQDAIILAKVAAWLGAHVHLCGSRADLDLGYTGKPG